MNYNLLEIFKFCKAKQLKKKKIRKGRGNSGRKGTYCGRGRKGYHARSGSSIDDLHEGGQTRTIKKIPKFGFINKNKIVYFVINIKTLLQRLSTLKKKKLISKYIDNNKISLRKIFNTKKPIKIVGDKKLNNLNKIDVDSFVNSINCNLDGFNFIVDNKIILLADKITKRLNVFFKSINII